MKNSIIHAALTGMIFCGIIFGSCSSQPDSNKDMRFSLGGGETDISARGAIGGLTDTEPVFLGDGGEGITLAILAPIIQGDVPNYLPLYIQGLLSNNIKKYSAITLIDRQNLEQVIKEQELSVSGRFSEDDIVKIGNITNAQYCLVGTIQKMSSSRYSLFLSVTGAASGVVKATTTQSGPLLQFEGTGALINAASADLLGQLDVKLTSRGKRALLDGSDFSVKAETGLARGILAQRSNETVTALFNFTQSLIFNPTQTEATNRLGLLSLAIGGGTTSERILTDLQARDQWLGIFKDTALFFENHAPFEITFDPNLIQDGETDFEKRTANLEMRVSLDPSPAAFEAINTLLEGLESTNRRRPWGFNGWPFLDIEPKIPEAVVFSGNKKFSYKMDVALLNDKGKELKKGSITLNSGELRFSSSDTRVAAPAGDKGMIQFRDVKVDDLTPVLTIVVIAVNNELSRVLNARGYMRIAPGDLDEDSAAGASDQTYRIGDRGPAGGLVFYDKGRFSEGWRYLEAAPSDTEFTARWGRFGMAFPNLGDGIGSGKRNTDQFIQYSSITGAAQLCARMNLNGFIDWFLPSINELELIYKNLKQRNLGGFGNNWYWSSSFQGDGKGYRARYLRFTDGRQGYGEMENSLSVRAIRSF